MNLKALKEKRNTLLNELETMISAVENETRSLSAEEAEAFEIGRASCRERVSWTV